MASASKTSVVNVSRDKMWKAILDYASYPQFVTGVHRVQIHNKDAGKSRVEYSIELMSKSISYTLDHVESTVPDKMSWSCIDSNFLKSNSGSWVIKDLGGDKCEVTYTVEIEFKIPVPSFMLGGLIKSSLPKLIEEMETKARSL